MNVPTSPDGKYHYFIGYAAGVVIGGAPVATDWPILATTSSIDTVRSAISSERGLPTVVVTSIGLLAAPGATPMP